MSQRRILLILPIVNLLLLHLHHLRLRLHLLHLHNLHLRLFFLLVAGYDDDLVFLLPHLCRLRHLHLHLVLVLLLALQAKVKEGTFGVTPPVPRAEGAVAAPDVPAVRPHACCGVGEALTAVLAPRDRAWWILLDMSQGAIQLKRRGFREIKSLYRVYEGAPGSRPNLHAHDR